MVMSYFETFWEMDILSWLCFTYARTEVVYTRTFFESTQLQNCSRHFDKKEERCQLPKWRLTAPQNFKILLRFRLEFGKYFVRFQLRKWNALIWISIALSRPVKIIHTRQRNVALKRADSAVKKWPDQVALLLDGTLPCPIHSAAAQASSPVQALDEVI